MVGVNQTDLEQFTSRGSLHQLGPLTLNTPPPLAALTQASSRANAISTHREFALRLHTQRPCALTSQGEYGTNRLISPRHGRLEEWLARPRCEVEIGKRSTGRAATPTPTAPLDLSSPGEEQAVTGRSS
ncbi:hypothetical protein RRG08_053346 [Elysia crispata]|uniref:Uncharacterized protein n=1 Tax=Elysia crispata TaxID=231223 RepID=A0AAE0ZKL3_9GAST|nr:hypothetical protein RRG08_053346 [Elysia crispata]